MPYQLSEIAARLLNPGEILSFGNRPDNLVSARVIGPGTELGTTRIRFLEDYHTRRMMGGNSFYRIGAEITVKAERLWRDTPGPNTQSDRFPLNFNNE